MLKGLVLRFIFVLVLTVLRVPAAVEAISNTETFGGFEFNFNNPGARALGMGYAFVAVADDATAVVSNPAGLVILQRPELSAEAKFVTYSDTILGYSNTLQEGLAGVYNSRVFDDSVTIPSFFSFVYPTEHVVVSAFVRELVNYKSDFSTQPVFVANPQNPAIAAQLFPVKSSLQITALDFGLGVGINLAKMHPLLPNVGASVELSIGRVNSSLQRFNLSSTSVISQTTVDGTDISAGLNVGLLWRPLKGLEVWQPLKELSLGAVYRRGPKYEMQQTLQQPPFPTQVFDFTLKVPDVYGGGVAYRLLDRLTLSLDVYRILYSQLLDDFQVVFTPSAVTASQFKVNDATTVHVGAECVFFPWNIPIALRVGYFSDPDHKIRYTGPVTTQNQAFEKVLFPGGRDVNHFTGGFGIVPFRGLQIDFATSQSPTVKEYAISTVYRF